MGRNRHVRVFKEPLGRRGYCFRRPQPHFTPRPLAFKAIGRAESRAKLMNRDRLRKDSLTVERS